MGRQKGGTRPPFCEMSGSSFGYVPICAVNREVARALLPIHTFSNVRPLFFGAIKHDARQLDATGEGCRTHVGYTARNDDARQPGTALERFVRNTGRSIRDYNFGLVFLADD